MGGIGSGRRYQGGKGTTDAYRSLDVRRLQRDGMLEPGQASGWNWYRNGEEVASIFIRTEANRLLLEYQHQSRGGPWQAMQYPISLEWTGCNLGGQRAWFLCPAVGCGKRVAILYIGGPGIFACRHCYQLAYESQRESSEDRAARRADTIRRRLGWKVGILNPSGGKPMGMHWRTFAHLKAKHDALVGEALAGMARRFGWLDRLNRLLKNRSTRSRT